MAQAIALLLRVYSEPGPRGGLPVPLVPRSSHLHLQSPIARLRLGRDAIAVVGNAGSLRKSNPLPEGQKRRKLPKPELCTRGAL
jgi:hypothetical protein